MENNETTYRSPGVLNAELHEFFEQQGPLNRKIGELRRAAEEQYKLSEMTNDKIGLANLKAILTTLDKAESFHSLRAEHITDAARLIRKSGKANPAAVQRQLQDKLLPTIAVFTSKIHQLLRVSAGVIEEVGAAETPLPEPKPAPKPKAPKPAPAIVSVEPEELAQPEPESVTDSGNGLEPESNETADAPHPKTASQPTSEEFEGSEDTGEVTPEWLAEELSFLSQEEQNEVITKANELRSNANPKADEPHVEVVEPAKKHRIKEETVRYAPAKEAGVKKSSISGLRDWWRKKGYEATNQPEPTDHHAQP